MMDYKDMNAIGIVRLMLTDGVISQEVAEKYFPELRVSKDEKIRKELINFFSDKDESDYEGLHPRNDIIAWLEKQGKNNMGISEATKQELADNLNKALEKETPESWNEFLEKQGKQKPAEWNEEDEINRDLVYNALNQVYDMAHNKDLSTWFNKRILLCSKQEWSEEDEYLLDETIKHLEALIRITKKQGSAYSDEIQYYQRDIDWLKSLRPQNHWKPSDEQMKALWDSIPEKVKEISEREMLLDSLYQDLKKLREE